MMLRDVVIFLMVFGLEENKWKFEMYGNNIDEEILSRIIRILCFKKGFLFLRYLGVFVSL